MHIPCKSLPGNNAARELAQVTREWHAKRDGRASARAKAMVRGGGGMVGEWNRKLDRRH